MCNCFSCNVNILLADGRITQEQRECLLAGYFFGKVSVYKSVMNHIKHPKDQCRTLDDYVDTEMGSDECSLDDIVEDRRVGALKELVEGSCW